MIHQGNLDDKIKPGTSIADKSQSQESGKIRRRHDDVSDRRFSEDMSDRQEWTSKKYKDDKGLSD